MSIFDHEAGQPFKWSWAGWWRTAEYFEPSYAQVSNNSLSACYLSFSPVCMIIAFCQSFGTTILWTDYQDRCHHNCITIRLPFCRKCFVNQKELRSVPGFSIVWQSCLLQEHHAGQLARLPIYVAVWRTSWHHSLDTILNKQTFCSSTRVPVREFVPWFLPPQADPGLWWRFLSTFLTRTTGRYRW